MLSQRMIRDMAFQQEIFRRFASDTNARVLCANQKKTRDSSRSLGHARAFTDRVTSLHGRGGLSSPALSDSLHSTASSSGPFTTSSLDPGYACDRGSRLSDGSSTDFGGSPLLSPPASAPAASHSRPHCPIDASLRSPPVQPIAADALPPTAPAQSLAVSKGQKSQSEGLHPSVGQVDGLNRTMQGRVKDDGGATQNNRRAQDSEVDTVVTQPRAQSPLVGLRR